MKYLLSTILLLHIVQFVLGQSTNNRDSDEKINLNWKLDKGDTIFYKTLMHNVKTEIDGHSPFQELIKNTEFAEMLKKQIENTNLITYLTNSENFENVIDIELVGKHKEKSNPTDDVEIDFMNAFMQGTLVRGAIKKSGEVYSFWLNRAQLNLISMFFELPGQPISVGDTWQLNNLSLIGNDQNFKCEEAERTNRVELIELLTTETDTIAILDYKIREYVKGTFSMNNPFGSISNKDNEATEYVNELTKARSITIDYSFSATAKFSITKGRWTSLNGVLSAKSTGIMGNTSTTQNYALEEIK